MRVVSLVPSVTETLLAWGVAPAACTRFCEQPSLPHVGGTKDPDVAAIAALAPDLVVMDEEENRREDAEALRAAGVPLHVTAVRSLDDVAPTLAALAAVLNVLPCATGARAPVSQGRTRVRAFVPIWRKPWMTLNGDTYGSTLLAAVGVENVFAAATERYPTVTLDQARAAQPDVVLAPSEPYPFTQRQVPELEQVAPVVLVDGHDLFWWGVRTPAALARFERVAES
jgi:ABC-type Fe3+-hydroxamate transport system substrate-binding protein